MLVYNKDELNKLSIIMIRKIDERWMPFSNRDYKLFVKKELHDNIAQLARKIQVYGINYDKDGCPLFLFYKDDQWVENSAKYYIPCEEINNFLQNFLKTLKNKSKKIL